MKEEFGGFIGELVSKLDKSVVILLLPIVITIYVCFFIPDNELEYLFGIETKTEIVTCPSCGCTLEISFKDGKYQIKKEDIK